MNKVTMNGNEMVLDGDLPEVGAKIKDFLLHGAGLEVKTNKDYAGKALLIVVVPSIDTPVCDMEIKKFEKDAGNLPKDIQVLGISVDLPFAQSRWAMESDIKNITMLSDYYNNDFGKNFGILIKDLHLLARAVFVYDKHGILIYKELVSEVTKEPDYGKALEAAKKAI